MTEEQIKAQIAALQAELAALEQTQPARADFDQQEQTVTTQLNVANLYQIYLAAPGRPQLSKQQVQRTVVPDLGARYVQRRAVVGNGQQSGESAAPATPVAGCLRAFDVGALPPTPRRRPGRNPRPNGPGGN